MFASSILITASEIASLELGSMSKARSRSRNSVKGAILEAIAGILEAIASNITKPQPSLIEGKTKASAQRYNDIKRVYLDLPLLLVRLKTRRD